MKDAGVYFAQELVRRALFDRAIERGEIPPTTNVELALDLLYGPLYHPLLHGHAGLHERSAWEVVDVALRGLVSPQAEQPDRPVSNPRESDAVTLP